MTISQSDRDTRADANEEDMRRRSDGSLAEDVGEAAQTISTAVREQLSEVTADIGREAEKVASELKARGSDAIKVYAHAAHAAASDLEQHRSPQAAARVHAAANSVDAFSDRIRSGDVNELLREVRQAARTQPALFFGGAVAVGFAFARFIKSSDHRAPGRQPGLGTKRTMP